MKDLCEREFEFSATISAMEKRASAGGIVLNAKGEIALVRNGPVFWGLPKGHVDPGEDTLTAAKREIWEETGLTHLKLIREIGTYERYRGTEDGSDDLSELKTITMFLFTTTEETLSPQDSSNPEARWVVPQEVKKMLTHPKDREFFKKVDVQI